MFRIAARRLCPTSAAAAAAAAHPTVAASTVHQPYYAAYNEAKSTAGNPLGSGTYAFLLARLQNYRELQSAYAVRQNDVERARKAGQMCGLEFTGSYRGPRRRPTRADGTVVDRSAADQPVESEPDSQPRDPPLAN